MRVIVLIKANENTEAGVMPSEKMLAGNGEIQRRTGEGGRDARR